MSQKKLLYARNVQTHGIYKKRPTAVTVDHNEKPYLVSTTKKQNINDIM